VAIGGRSTALDDLMAQSYEALLLSIVTNLQSTLDSLRKESRDEARETRRAVVEGDSTLRTELTAVDGRLSARIQAVETEQESVSLALAAQRARAGTYGALAAAIVSFVAAPLFTMLLDALRK
jgi:hypothetical protein